MKRPTPAGVSLVVVAAVCAVLSYRHMYAVILEHTGDPVDATLGPLTADGLLITTGAALSRRARAGLSRDWLVLAMFAAGCVVSLAGNVLHGLGEGAITAVINAWPALALMATYEAWLRNKAIPSPMAAKAAPMAATAPSVAAKRPARRRRGRGHSITDEIRVEAAAILATRPTIAGAQLAREVGVPERTGARLKRDLVEAAAKGDREPSHSPTRTTSAAGGGA